MEKLPQTIVNQILSWKCAFGIGYGIGRKYWPIWVWVLVCNSVWSYVHQDLVTSLEFFLIHVTFLFLFASKNWGKPQKFMKPNLPITLFNDSMVTHCQREYYHSLCSLHCSCSNHSPKIQVKFCCFDRKNKGQ